MKSGIHAERCKQKGPRQSGTLEDVPTKDRSPKLARANLLSASYSKIAVVEDAL